MISIKRGSIEVELHRVLRRAPSPHGNEHRYLRGLPVGIIAAIQNAAKVDYDPDDGY